MSTVVNEASLEERIAALASMTYGELAQQYLEIFGKIPRVRDRRWLRRKIAWQLQANEHGGLSDRAKAKLDEIIAALGITFDGKPQVKRVHLARRKSHGLGPGEVIRKTYRGNEVVVRVLDDGFEWNGKSFATLSEVATAVTGGQHLNARLFFGITKRARR